MSSVRASGLPPNFILTPQQQNLLFRALTSNKPSDDSPANNALTLSPTSLTDSPMQPGMKAEIGNINGYEESPLLDYDYDFGPDSSFDFDFANGGNGRLIGDMPGESPDEGNSKASSPDNDSPEKRGHPDDEDEEQDDGSAKRRESEGKVPKKPGRKPLTNEPSSVSPVIGKRKAQNRAAQRAFRERKEQHLKDLETKVEELEKSSQATTSENSQLRAKVEKMTMELNEYKKRTSLMNSSRSTPMPNRGNFFGQGLVNNINDVNFQFEFPKFGVLPGPGQSMSNGVNDPISAKQAAFFPSPASNFSTNAKSSPSETRDRPSPATNKSRENSDAQTREALAKLIGSGSPYDTNGNSVSRSSLDSVAYSLGGTASTSPSASSQSNGGPSSSCGTSPEPFTQSPLGFKPVDMLSTIGEEQSSLSTDTATNKFGTFGNVDFTNFDWLASQNGGQFDPQLFGDYREPQENILANNTFDDSFFNDAFEADFATPFNVAPSPNLPKKTNILAEIDAMKEKDEFVVADVNGKVLTCNNIWEKLQNCPKVQTGDIDLDGLCSDLQKKAKCGGSGAVVDEKDFRAVMTKHLGEGTCVDSV